MGERQRLAAPPGKEGHLVAAEDLDPGRDLDVPELAEEEVASSPARGPAEQHVAGRLHEPVAVHDPLAVVGEVARGGVGLQHRGARLLDLEEERVPLVGHQQQHPAHGAHAADADHLDRDVLDLVAVEQQAIGDGRVSR